MAGVLFACGLLRRFEVFEVQFVFDHVLLVFSLYLLGIRSDLFLRE